MELKTIKRLEFDKILGLLKDCTSTTRGRELAEELLPSTDYSQVSEILEETTQAKELLRLEPGFSIGGVKDLRGVLKRVSMGALLEATELMAVYFTLYAGRKVKSFILNRKGEYPRIKDLANEIIVLPQVETEINNAITEGGEIADHASTELASLRRQIAGKQQKIKEKLEHIIRSSQYQKMLQDPIVTIRGDRYVVPIKQEYRVQFPGMVHDQSASGATLFIEPLAAVELNNDIRRLAAKEKAEIERILTMLTRLVYANIEIIEGNSLILAKLDFILAKARLSQKMDAGAARLTKQFNLNIIQGRHPLIAGKVVPTNIYLGKDFDTLLITGPNTGGKTVTLKTVGLFALMTQSGLHIPAEEGTEMPIIRQIFSDIGDEQSIEQSLSTFSSHMKNIINILQAANRDDLVLMDEVGAGTDPSEGAALAMAILEELHQRGVKTIATTHYSELKNFAYSQERIENASVEFNVETLQPTYRLMIGQPGRSNAFEIARKLGLPATVVKRGKDFISQEEMKMADLLENLEDNRRVAEKELSEAMELHRKIQQQKYELNLKEEELEEKRIKVLAKANEEAFEIIREAKKDAEELIKQLKQTLAEESERNKQRAIEDARHKIRDIEGKVVVKNNHLNKALPHKVPKKVVPGELVFVPKLNQKGHVVDVSPNGDVVVQVGIMKLTVKIKELQITQEDKKEEGQATFAKVATEKVKNIKNEIDLRGLMVDEATVEVEKFLDDAYLAGLGQVYIIHGKGTGALRSAMQGVLKKHQFVKNFRLGQYGEGGTGVTVVEIS